MEVAAQLDINAETVRRHCREGAPFDRRGTRFMLNVAEYQAWMKANGKTGEQGRPPIADSPNIEKARLRKENALAAKYELQVAKERGALVAIDAVREWMIRNFTSAKNRMLGVASRVVPLLDGRDASEQQTIIEDAIREALAETGEAVTSLDDRLAAA